MEKILDIQHLNKSYGNHEVLKDISFSVDKGEVISIIGASGSGKSTLLRCINLLEEPNGGAIIYNGNNLLDSNQPINQYRAKLGMVFQHFNLFPNHDALKNCTVAQVKVLGRTEREAEKVAKKYLNVVGMGQFIHARPKQLSGGQQQRIAIARLFLKDPPIIFLDEPTASLDAIATEQIKNSLDAIKEGRTVVIISHSLSQILDSDRIYVMKKGMVVENGTHDELIQMNGSYREIFDASARSLNLDKLFSSFKEN